MYICYFKIITEQAYLKTLYKILITIVIILIVAVSTIPWVLGPLIKTGISKVSNGSIAFDYTGSHTNIFSRVISFDSVVFSFNNVTFDSVSELMIKKLTFKKFTVEKLSLTDLLLNNEFYVHKLVFNSPELWLNKDTAVFKKDFTSQQSLVNFFKKKKGIKKSEFLFHIDEFEINQGGFVFTDKNNDKTSIQGMNLLVTDLGQENFKANDDDLFNFKARLELMGVEKIASHLYKSRVESFVIDTKQNNVVLKGISLTPLKEPDSANPVLYTANSDLLDIEGIKIKDILQKTEFQVKNITIKNTGITETHFSEEKLLSTNNHRQDTLNIFSFFPEYKINTVNFNNINYQSVNIDHDTSELIRIGALSIKDIKIDSSTFSGFSNNSLVNNTTVSSQAVYVKLGEPDIEVRYDTLIFSGPDTTVHIGNLSAKLTCSSAGDDSVAKCDLKARFITLHNVTPESLSSEDGGDISVHIDNWSADINNPSNIRFKKGENQPFKLAKKLNFKTISINNGDIKVSKEDAVILNLKRLNFSTTRLTVFTDNSKNHNVIDYDTLKSGFDNLEFEPDTNFFVRISDCKLNDDQLSVSGLNLINDANDKTDFSFNGFKITGFDIKRLVNKKEFKVKSFIVNKPEINHTLFSQTGIAKNDSLNFKQLRQRLAREIGKHLNKLDIESVVVSNGNLDVGNNSNETVVRSHFTLQTGNIKFSKRDARYNKEISVGFVRFVLKQTDFRSKDYSMRYDSVIVDTKSNKISFVNSLILSKPGKTANGNKKSEFHAIVPKIDIIGPDFNAYLYHPMSFSSMVIDNPEVNLLIHSKKKNSRKAEPLTGDIPFSFFKEYIKMKKGKINIIIESEKDTTVIKAADISAVWYERIPKPPRGVAFSRHEQMHKADVVISDFVFKNSTNDIRIAEIKHKVNGSRIRIKGFNQSAYKTGNAGRELTNKVIIPDIIIENPLLHKSMGKLSDFDVREVIAPKVDIDFYQLHEKTIPGKHLNFKDSTLRPLFNFLGHFTVDSTKIENLHFQYFSKNQNKKPFDITRMSIVVKGLSIDSSLFTKNKSIIKDMNIRFYKREIKTKNGLYLIKSNNIAYSYKDNILILDSVYMIPRYGRDEFFRKAVYQTDRMQISGKNIIVEGIDFESILTKRIYHFSRVSLNGIRMKNHRDKRYKRKPDDVKPMPQAALRNLPMKISIDTLNINDSYVLYGEYVDKSPKPGEVYFTGFNVKVHNITNVPEVIENNPVMDVALTANLMDDAKLNLDMKFILNDPYDYFNYSGHLNNFDITKMNSMSENLFGLTIKSGKGTLDIKSILGNNEFANGKLYFKYKNLKLGLYNRSKAKEVTGILSPIVSFVVNDIKLRSNNPKSLGKPRIGDVYFERDPQKSILNYIWKSTMSGLLSTLGISNKQLKEAQKSDKKTNKNNDRINKQFEKKIKDLDGN